MAYYTDEQIILANNAKIKEGDYVVFPGTLAIKWVVKDVNKVDIKYERRMGNNVSDVTIAQNVNCDLTNVNTYNWVVNIVANPNEDYPTYRIKIVSTVSNNVVAFSNPFKISVNMAGVTGEEEE